MGIVQGKVKALRLLIQKIILALAKRPDRAPGRPREGHESGRFFCARDAILPVEREQARAQWC
jgi:hypothetical protein